MAARAVSPIDILSTDRDAELAVTCAVGNIASWVNGTEIVIPLNEKLRLSVSD
jgi:hypothetical protein